MGLWCKSVNFQVHSEKDPGVKISPNQTESEKGLTGKMTILSSLAPSSIASRTYELGGRFSRPVKNCLNSRSHSGEEMHLQSTWQSWKASTCLCADRRFQWRLFGGVIEQMHPAFPASSSPTSSDPRTIGSKTNPRRQHATDSTDWTLSERSDVALARNTMLAGRRKAASAGTRSGKKGWEKAASEQRAWGG